MNRRGFLTAALRWPRARSSAPRRFELLVAAGARRRLRADRRRACSSTRSASALGRDPRGALRSLREHRHRRSRALRLERPRERDAVRIARARPQTRVRRERHSRADLAHRRRPHEHGGDRRDRTRARDRGASCVALPSEFSGTVDGRFAMVPAQSRAQLDALAEKLNRVGREYRDHGLDVRLSQPSHRVHARRRRRALRLLDEQHGSEAREDRARRRLARDGGRRSRDVLAPARRPRHRVPLEGLRSRRSRATCRSASSSRRAPARSTSRPCSRRCTRRASRTASSRSTSPTTRSATCAAATLISRVLKGCA